MARSTVYGILRRHGMNRLADTDRTSGAVVRYERERPGELVHIDVKKLGRIPDGGGHRAHGRARAARGRGIGYDYVHSAIDDRSRVAFSQTLADETGETSARFLVEAAGFLAEHGVRIERVLTDNAKAYADSVVFAETAAGLGIRLKRIRPYRPQTNGKVERFNKTLLDEWAYGRLYRSNDERRQALSRWLRFYNHRRPHTSLDGLTRWRSSSTTLVGSTPPLGPVTIGTMAVLPGSRCSGAGTGRTGFGYQGCLFGVDDAAQPRHPPPDQDHHQSDQHQAGDLLAQHRGAG
jgi:transposase InsO family protein